MSTTMERSYTTIDKSTWGEGPWADEPDKLQFVDEATGLPCLIVRNHVGALCGYVGVGWDHPWYGRPYDDGLRVDVHGGLTYSDSCRHGDESNSICHVPAPGEPDDVWWLGFDCAHVSDYSPALARYRLPPCSGGVYRTVEYVRNECARLAAQLAGVEMADDRAAGNV